MKKIAKVVLAVMALACLVVLSACGGSKWPSSYNFNGQLVSDTGSADVTLALNEDKSVSMEAAVAGAVSGKWSGTWEQNKDGTVTVTFATAASEAVEGAMFEMSLNDADTDLGGMGGLAVTSTISNDINTLTVLVNVAIGDGYTMAFEGVLTQAAA